MEKSKTESRDRLAEELMDEIQRARPVDLSEDKDFQKIRRAIIAKIPRVKQKSGKAGKPDPLFLSKVDEYMSLYESFYNAKRHVKIRGESMRYLDSRGQLQEKRNDMVDVKIKVSAQMLKVLAYLGIEPEELPTEPEISDGSDL